MDLQATMSSSLEILSIFQKVEWYVSKSAQL